MCPRLFSARLTIGNSSSVARLRVTSGITRNITLPSAAASTGCMA